jgi:hypothetical protein
MAIRPAKAHLIDVRTTSKPDSWRASTAGMIPSSHRARRRTSATSPRGTPHKARADRSATTPFRLSGRINSPPVEGGGTGGYLLRSLASRATFRPGPRLAPLVWRAVSGTYCCQACHPQIPSSRESGGGAGGRIHAQTQARPAPRQALGNVPGSPSASNTPVRRRRRKRAPSGGASCQGPFASGQATRATPGCLAPAFPTLRRTNTPLHPLDLTPTAAEVGIERRIRSGSIEDGGGRPRP